MTLQVWVLLLFFRPWTLLGLLECQGCFPQFFSLLFGSGVNIPKAELVLSNCASSWVGSSAWLDELILQGVEVIESLLLLDYVMELLSCFVLPIHFEWQSVVVLLGRSNAALDARVGHILEEEFVLQFVTFVGVASLDGSHSLLCVPVHLFILVLLVLEVYLGDGSATCTSHVPETSGCLRPGSLMHCKMPLILVARLS